MSVSYFQAKKKKKKTSSAQATTQVLFLETTILLWNAAEVRNHTSYCVT